MLDKNLEIKVQNRDSGVVGYTIPDLGIHRSFMPGETKTITVDEIRKLSYMPGGMSIIKNYLLVRNGQLVEEILGYVEPEYAYTANDIKKLLVSGSLDELKDCLDFAPKGVIELVKKIAVDIKLNDINKRKAIKDSTGFNIDSMIELKIEDEKDSVKEPKKERRVTSNKTQTKTARRVEAPKKSVDKE